MLWILDIFYLIEGCFLFEDVVVMIFVGYKVGFVGCNGVGKIILFKLICGDLYFDNGVIDLFKGWCIGGVS